MAYANQHEQNYLSCEMLETETLIQPPQGEVQAPQQQQQPFFRKSTGKPHEYDLSAPGGNKNASVPFSTAVARHSETYIAKEHKVRRLQMGLLGLFGIVLVCVIIVLATKKNRAATSAAVACPTSSMTCSSGSVPIVPRSHPFCQGVGAGATYQAGGPAGLCSAIGPPSGTYSCDAQLVTVTMPSYECVSTAAAGAVVAGHSGFVIQSVNVNLASGGSFSCFVCQ